MPFPYPMSTVIADIRRWTVDPNSAIPTADLTALFNSRYFDWWAKYVERPESVLPSANLVLPETNAASGTDAVEWALGSQDDYMRYTLSPTTSIVKFHYAFLWGKLQTDPAPVYSRNTGDYIVPISNFEKVLNRRQMSTGLSTLTGLPDELGLRIYSREASQMKVDVCLPINSIYIPNQTYDYPCLGFVCTLNPTPMTTTGTDFPDLNESAVITLARLTAYDAATLLERGPSYIADILSPVDASVLADFQLDTVLRDARKALYASRG